MKRVTDIGDLGVTFVEHDAPLTKTKDGKTKGSSLGGRRRDLPGKTEPTTPTVVLPDLPPSPVPAPHEEEARSPWPWLAAALGVAVLAGGVGWAVGRARCAQCAHEGQGRRA